MREVSSLIGKSTCGIACASKVCSADGADDTKQRNELRKSKALKYALWSSLCKCKHIEETLVTPAIAITFASKSETSRSFFFKLFYFIHWSLHCSRDVSTIVTHDTSHSVTVILCETLYNSHASDTVKFSRHRQVYTWASINLTCILLLEVTLGHC